MSEYIYIHIYTYTYMHAYVYIYTHVCIQIRWTCTYIFKYTHIHMYIYKHIYIYNTHINPVCEETLGSLVLQYIYMYVTENTPNVCFVFLQLCSSQSDTLRPDPPTFYMYICIYVYAYIYMYSCIHIYICMCIYVCVYKKHIYTYTYICMYPLLESRLLWGLGFLQTHFLYHIYIVTTSST